MNPKNAVKICENDPACGGFTYKGAFSGLDDLDDFEAEVYFFHFVPSNTTSTASHFNWSTYRVKTRDHVVLENAYIKDQSSKPCQNNGKKCKVAAYQVTSSEEDCPQNRNKTFSNLDFSEVVFDAKNPSKVVIKLASKNVLHTLPKLDRCCKLNGRTVNFDGVDNVRRISCDIPPKEFREQYLYKREAVMLTGCMDEWPAKNWTFDGLLRRYEQIGSNWTIKFQTPNMTKDHLQFMNSTQILELRARNDSTTMRIFDMLYRSLRRNKHYRMTHKLDLIDEYSRPKPMPPDLLEIFRIENNQNYLMMATKDTG